MKRVRMPSATSIVARSYPDKIIGSGNKLPWHLGTDMRLFRERTSGHAIIMGRKTWDSIGRPLPNRMNIVLSRNPVNESKNLIWARDPETALLLADYHSILLGKNTFYVIGGDQIYKIFDRYINRVYLTEVFGGKIIGDAYFDVEYFNEDRSVNYEWILIGEDEFPSSEADDYPFRITQFRRRVPFHRYRVKEELMGRFADIDSYLRVYEAKMAMSEREEQLDLQF